jgi:anti-sigma factor RsiW
MKYDEQLKLQAHLDGELSESESSEVAAMLAHDLEAQQLLTELQHTRTALRENEPEYVVPESREFYWSKIERAISRSQVPTVAEAGFALKPFRVLLRRFLAPVTAVAGLALVLVFVFKDSPVSVTTDHNYVAEVETVIDGMGAVTYRSYTEGLTFVWFYNQYETGFAEPSGASNL